MKIVRIHRLLMAAATVGLGAMGSAHAALTQLDITYNQDWTGNITWFNSANNTTTTDNNIPLTAFKATRMGGDLLPPPTSDPFYTFCMDIAPTLIGSDWWKSGTFPLAGNANGNSAPYVNGGVQRAASLYKAYVGGVDFSDVSHKREGAALQLAIWEVLYENGPYDVTSGTGFSIASASDALITARANVMLGSAANFADYNLTSTFWNATDSNGESILNQDLIGPQLPTGFVPEPGTCMAAASVFAYLAAFGIRRARRS